ncbi:TetR/AcrR family transcriptional regulator [Glaciecola sp. MF2-115]|uniref:TetR/AcrR family transcriptional regulator n=1 Tax=Glaciecola sp. MF2-115 TaxID=3384827 RepID=UPI00399FC340
MPKQAQYDLPEILTYAVDIFTEQGYAKASMEEIIGRTQFNRRAFYIEFKSKKGFLHAVLAHYIENNLSACQESLIARKDSGTQAIYDYFQAYYELISKQGCLLVNCISELGRNDEKVQSIARHYYDSLQLCFIACLERAQKHQQIKSTINIESVALQLTCFTQGFAVSSILQNGEDDVIIAMRELMSSIEL